MAKYQQLIFSQFLVASSGLWGSLFFSEVLKLPPCDLCWYQRVFLYPVALITLTGLFIQSKETHKFIMPNLIIGFVISVYHNLIYYKVIPVIIPCGEGVSCTTQQLNLFGFITIPMLSLCAFILLIILNLTTTLLAKKDS